MINSVIEAHDTEVNGIVVTPQSCCLNKFAKFGFDRFAANIIRTSGNGIGISTEQCDRLFNLYFRGKRSRCMPGLGIGLYVSKHLGNGSTFWFTLPYLKV